MEIKTLPSGLQLSQPRKGAVQALGPAASRVKSKFFSTLAGHLLYAGCITAASFVRGGLHFAEEGMEALKGGGFALGHWAGELAELRWESSLTLKLVPIPFNFFWRGGVSGPRRHYSRLNQQPNGSPWSCKKILEA